MEPESDRELGELAVRSRLLSKEELDACLEAQKLHPRPLTEVLHDLHLLTLLQIDNLKSEQRRTAQKSPPPTASQPSAAGASLPSWLDTDSRPAERPAAPAAKAAAVPLPPPEKPPSKPDAGLPSWLETDSKPAQRPAGDSADHPAPPPPVPVPSTAKAAVVPPPAPPKSDAALPSWLETDSKPAQRPREDETIEFPRGAAYAPPPPVPIPSTAKMAAAPPPPPEEPEAPAAEVPAPAPPRREFPWETKPPERLERPAEPAALPKASSPTPVPFRTPVPRGPATPARGTRIRPAPAPAAPPKKRRLKTIVVSVVLLLVALGVCAYLFRSEIAAFLK